MHKISFLILILSSFSFSQDINDSVSFFSLKSHLTTIASDNMEGRLTGTKGIELAAKYIEEQYKKMGLIPINKANDYRQKYRLPKSLKKSSNLIGCIEGQIKNEYVVITAHYDHVGIREGKIYNGADDNGSGTAALLSIAEAIMKKKKDGYLPTRSIVFIAFSGEELGLLGSRFFSLNPIIPFEKISCNINLEMLGRIDPDRLSADSLNYVHIIGQSKNSNELSWILEDLNTSKHNLVIDTLFKSIEESKRLYYKSDHYNFGRKGVPIICFFDGMLKGDYHGPGDDVEKIIWKLYLKRVNLILDLVLALSDREHLLKRNSH